MIPFHSGNNDRGTIEASFLRQKIPYLAAGDLSPIGSIHSIIEWCEDYSDGSDTNICRIAKAGRGQICYDCFKSAKIYIYMPKKYVISFQKL